MSRYYPLRPPTRRLIVHRFIYIHLLNLRDGSPYRVPPSNVIARALPPGLERIHIQDLTATGSRLMMQIPIPGWRAIVWNWKTGDLVRGLQSWPRFSQAVFPGVRQFQLEWGWAVRG